MGEFEGRLITVNLNNYLCRNEVIEAQPIDIMARKPLKPFHLRTV